MRVVRTGDAAEFLREAAPLLLPNEARDNLVFGIAAGVRDAPERWPGARFWIAIEAGDPRRGRAAHAAVQPRRRDAPR